MKLSLLQSFKKLLFKNSQADLDDYKVSPLFAVFTVVFTLAIIINSGVLIFNARLYQNKMEENRLLTEELRTNKQIIETDLDQSNDEYAEAILKQLMPASQLASLSKSFWSYELTINGSKVTSNDVEISGNSAIFLLKQSEKDKVLPKNLHNRGSVTAGDVADKFYEHPLFDPTKKVTITPPLSNANPAVAIYEIKDLKSGDSFTVTLTPPLQERLALPKNVINVKVK